MPIFYMIRSFRSIAIQVSWCCGDQGAMITGLAVAIAVFGHGDWANTKSTINAAGEITIRSRKVDTGAVTSTRYRMTKGEHAEKWVDD